MTTPKPARTRRGDGFASVGAVPQRGGPLPVYICNTCDREVVWAESAKTGRRYLANVRRGYHDQRFYIAASLHSCKTVLDARQADRDHLDAQWRQVGFGVVGALRILAGYEPEPFAESVSMPATLRDLSQVAIW